MLIPQISAINQNFSPNSNLALKQNSNNCFENLQVQNSLSFSQANALKNSLLINNVNFKGKVLAPSFDIKDIKIIQNLLSKCRYGKKDLIYGDISQIKLTNTDFGSAIENFYTKDDNKNGKISGICEELTYKLGKRLEKLFGDKYIFFAIDGSNKEFGGHTYIGALKNTTENSQKIVSIMKKQQEYLKLPPKVEQKIIQINQEFQGSKIYQEYNSKINDITASFIAKFGENTDMDAIKSLQSDMICAIQTFNNTTLGKEYSKEMNEVNKKINQLKNPFDINKFSGCLLIDPSFNRVEEFGCKGTVFNGYNSNSIRTLNQINAVPSNSRITLGMPLGYLKDLIPELSNKKNANSIVGLNAGTKISVMANDGSEIKMDTLGKNHPFAKFIAKLNENLSND